MKTPRVLVLVIAAAALFGQDAAALTITNPLSLDHQYVVGILDGDPGNQSSDEAAIAQAILNLALGGTAAFVDGGTLHANTTYDFSGTITGPGVKTDPPTSLNIAAGWEYVIGKYDGQQAGYVLFALGGQAATIPQYPYNLWTTNTSQYAISHYTTFNRVSVPEGGSTLILLSGALAGLAAMRRRWRR